MRIGSMLAGLAVLAAASAPLSARAWEPIDPVRPVWNGVAEHAMTRGGSDDLGAERSEALVREAFVAWTAVSCGPELSGSWTGLTNERPDGRGSDGTPAIGWIESGWRHDSSVIGRTTIFVPAGRRIVEADIELNGEDYTWSEEGGRLPTVHAATILGHEVGHFLGLGHSSHGGALMHFAYTGEARALGRDDARGVCALYPEGGADCTVTGCADGERCSAGVCEPAPERGERCAPCDAPEECAGEVCVGYPDGDHFCGSLCNDDFDCGGDSCVDVMGTGLCVRERSPGVYDCSAPPPPECRFDSDCRPGDRCAADRCEPEGPGEPIGAPCEAGASCASTLCFDGRCASTCDFVDVASCPEGFYCNGDATGICGSGICQPSVEGSGRIGDPCDRDRDCASQTCVSGECTEPCHPMAAGESCPPRYECAAATAPTCGFCRPVGDGTMCARCNRPADCLSGGCLAYPDGRGYCGDVCDTDDDCSGTDRCADVEGMETRHCARLAAGEPTCSDLAPDCAIDLDCRIDQRCEGGRCVARGPATEPCAEAPCDAGADEPGVDGGVPPEATDGAAVRGDGGTAAAPEVTDGCGCTIPSGERSTPWELSLIAATLLVRRRRRGR